jgi:hypothetical protein
MDRLQKRALLLFPGILVTAAVVTFFVVRGTAASSGSGFSVPPFEKNAVTGEPDTPEQEKRYSSMEIENGFAVSLCTNLTANDRGETDVYFTSDKDNLVWVRLVLLSEDGTELGSTGILKPDQYVKTIKLSSVPEETETITLKILSYEPETYYSEGSASAEAVLTGVL